jgi:hypothetical protein
VLSGDVESFELAFPGGDDVPDDDGDEDDNDFTEVGEALLFDLTTVSGRKARFFHVLLLLYRRVFSNRFLRLCSDMTCDLMRFSVASREPPLTDCTSALTQNSGDRLFALRGAAGCASSCWAD